DEESTAIDKPPPKQRRRPDGRYAIHNRSKRNTGRRAPSEPLTTERPVMPQRSAGWEEERTVVDGNQQGNPPVAQMRYREDSSATLDEPTFDEPGRASSGLSGLASLSGPDVHSANAAAHRSSRPQVRPNDPASGRLLIVDGKDQGREYELFGKTVTIGRSLDNDIVLTDIAASRRHVALKYDGTWYRLTDQASGNGTVINGRIETGSCILGHGDRLELGQTVIHFEHPASQGLPPPALPGNAVDPAAEAARSAGRSPRESAPPHLAQANLAHADTERPRTALPLPQRDRPSTSAPLGTGQNDSSRAMSANMAPGEQRMGMPPSATPLPFAAFNPEQKAAMDERSGTELVGGRGAGSAVERSASFGSSGVPRYPSGSLPPGHLSGGMAAHSHSHSLPAGDPLRQSSFIEASPKKNRGLIYAVIVLMLFGGVAGALFFLGPRTGLLQDGKSGGDPAGNGDSAATGEQPLLPADTWGTSENLLTATAPRGAARKSPQGAAPDKSSDKADPGQGEVRPDPAATKTAAETERAGDESETDAADGAETGQPAESAKVAAVAKPSRSSESVSAKSRKEIEDSARRRAFKEYEKRRFPSAAQTLRSAAGNLGGKPAQRMRNLGENYGRVGSALRRGDSAAKSKPIDALRAYEQADSLDRRYGKGKHSKFIRSKLASVAPRAALAYLKRSSLEQAKRAADRAGRYGVASSNGYLKKVRSELEKKAAELYKDGLRMQRSDPAKATKLYQRVLKIVPPSSPSYGKASKKLGR
ncbi:MAG: FHA domain-containing protein, partial [Myxococcota bacterium]